MATPAASAWHRRRIFSDRLPPKAPSGAMSAMGEFNTLQKAPVAPTSHNSEHLRTNGYRYSTGTPYAPSLDASSLYRRQTASATTPAPAGPSLRRAVYLLFDPFISFAHSSLLQVCVAVVVTLSLLHVVRIFLMSTMGSFFLSCATNPPALSTTIRIVSFFMVPLLVLMQLASHFVLSRAIHNSPPAKGAFLAVALFSFPIHAIISAYLLYGPSLAPHRFFCSAPISVFPLRGVLHTPVITALAYVPALYACVFYLRAFSPPPFPFARSALRRAFVALPHAIAVAALPALPASLVAFAIATATRPPRPMYASLVLTAARAAAAVASVFAAALPQALLHVASGVRGGCTNIADGGPVADGVAREALVTTSSAASMRSALVALCRAPRTRMLPFPPFEDPSGRQWRVALDAALAPIALVAARLRATRRVDQMSLHPPGVVVAPSSKGLHLDLSDVTLYEAAAVTSVLPAAFEASVCHDQFGVALPTLPHALALLVLLHEDLSESIVARGEVVRPTFPLNLPRGLMGFAQEAMSWVADTVERRSQLSSLKSLKDIVAVCVYRLAFVFREEVGRFVEGREPSWDVQATEALRPFLGFDV